MLKRTFMILVATGLILPASVFTATQLNAQSFPPLAQMPGSSEDGPGSGGPREIMAERWIEELDLTEEQVTQIRAIREGSQDEMQALHDQLRAEREVMHTLMSGTETDDELRSQHQKVQALHQEVGDQRFENMLAVRAVLTPEQRAELGDRMEQRREQFRQNRQERRQQRVQ
jgi:Spy/CpxP family protein refolding chaperone